MPNLELKGLRLLRNLETSIAYSNEKNAVNDNISHLALEFLIPGKYQPRKHIDVAALNELADSIKVQGIIQPIIVRKIENDKYEVIAGERRCRAAAIAGLTQVPAIVRVIEDSVALAFSLIENIQRENLNSIEEAAAFSKFRDEFSLTHDEIAQMLGRSRVSVTNTLRLLSLDARVMKMLEDKKIDMGHARALLKLSPEDQYQLACSVINQQLNVRDTEALAHQWKLSKHEESNAVPSIKTPHEKCQEWSRHLSKQFTTNVSVKVNREGKGKVIIDVNAVSEIDWLINLINEKNQ